MVQEYVIVNLDKKEFIHPNDFGNRYKLQEFGRSSNSTMTALALLTASGNGHGLGDITSKVESTNPIPVKTDPRFKLDHTWEHTSTIGGAKTTYYQTYIPSTSGRWVGDRIVTLGDYSKDLDHLITPAEEIKTREFRLRYGWMQAHEEARVARKKLTLEAWLETPAAERYSKFKLFDVVTTCYTDIGDQVADELKAFGIGNTDFNEFVDQLLSRCLFAAYPCKEHRQGHSGRKDLRWMNFRVFDQFLLTFCEDRETLKACKAWTRKQALHMWQRKMLSHYIGYKTRSGRDRPPRNIDEIETILKEYGILQAGESLDTRDDFIIPLLPTADQIHAANAVTLSAAGRESLIPWQPGVSSQKSTTTPRERKRSIMLRDE